MCSNKYIIPQGLVAGRIDASGYAPKPRKTAKKGLGGTQNENLRKTYVMRTGQNRESIIAWMKVECKTTPRQRPKAVTGGGQYLKTVCEWDFGLLPSYPMVARSRVR